VAALRWLRENTNVPIPQVFAYDEDPGNVVGAPYMIQERVRISCFHPQCLFFKMTDHILDSGEATTRCMGWLKSGFT